MSSSLSSPVLAPPAAGLVLVPPPGISASLMSGMAIGISHAEICAE